MNSLKDVLTFLESKNIENLDVLDLDAQENELLDTEDMATDASGLASDEEEAQEETKLDYPFVSNIPSVLHFTYLGNLNTKSDELKAIDSLSKVLTGHAEGEVADWELLSNSNQVSLHHSSFDFTTAIPELHGLSIGEISQLLAHEHFHSEVPGVFEFNIPGEIDITHVEKHGLNTDETSQENVEVSPETIETAEVTEPSEEEIKASEENIKKYLAQLQQYVDTSTEEDIKAGIQEVILKIQKELANN